MFYISPSKTMKIKDLEALVEGPLLLGGKHSDEIRNQLLGYSVEALMDFYKVSEKVAQSAYALLRTLETGKAIDLFEGLVFKNLGYASLEVDARKYIDENVLIGSAMYGVVRANQRIRPYRLDLENPVVVHGQSLSALWSKQVTDAILKQEAAVLVDLSSEEYGALLDYTKIKKKKTVIKIAFRELKNGKLINGATYSKMARGQFIREAAVRSIQTLNALKDIEIMGYGFDEVRSDEGQYYFIK